MNLYTYYSPRLDETIHQDEVPLLSLDELLTIHDDMVMDLADGDMKYQHEINMLTLVNAELTHRWISEMQYAMKASKKLRQRRDKQIREKRRKTRS